MADDAKVQEMLKALGQNQQPGAASESAGKLGESIDLVNCIAKNHCTVLNSANSAQLQLILDPPSAHMRLISDEEVDEQLLIFVKFSQLVNIRKFVLRANSAGEDEAFSAPKIVKLFVNSSHIDFNDAGDLPATQDLDLMAKEIEGNQIALNFLKFQSVDSLVIFIESNQDDSDVTFINHLQFLGSVIDDFNMSNLKKSG
eukprot:89906_1